MRAERRVPAFPVVSEGVTLREVTSKQPREKRVGEQMFQKVEKLQGTMRDKALKLSSLWSRSLV